MSGADPRISAAGLATGWLAVVPGVMRSEAELIRVSKSLLFVCCFSAMAVSAQEQSHGVPLRIETEAASLSACTKDQPCTIEIEKTTYGYSARVLRAAMVSDKGVIKYLPSATYYQFNEHGEVIKRIASP